MEKETDRGLYIQISLEDKDFDSIQNIRSRGLTSEDEGAISKLLEMAEQTKYLYDENHQIQSGEEEESKQKEILEIFLNVEKSLYIFLNSLNLEDELRDVVEACISEKLLENFLKVSAGHMEMVKQLEKKYTKIYTLFISSLDGVKNLESYFGFELNYSKLDPDSCDSIKLMKQLKIMVNDLYLQYLTNAEANLGYAPFFLTQSFKKLLKEKILSDWQLNYEIPMKKLRLKKDDCYKFLNSKFFDLINDKFNLLDATYFSEEERFLLYELFFYSNVSSFNSSKLCKQTFLSNLKKYINLFGIKNYYEKICTLMSNFLDEVGEESSFFTITKANDIFMSKMNELMEILKDINGHFFTNKLYIIIFCYSLIFNNLLAYESVNSEIKICFIGEPKSSSREKMFLNKLLQNLENYLTNMPKGVSIFEINRICENFVYEPLIKSFSKFMFDENNEHKISIEKEQFIEKIDFCESAIEKMFTDLLEIQANFQVESNKTIHKIRKGVKDIFSYVGFAFGIKKENRSEIDISKLKLYPYDRFNTSTHVCLCIGGAIVGDNSQKSIWQKLYLRSNNIEYYFLDWVSNHIPNIGFYLLELLPRDDMLYERRDFVDRIENNDILHLKEKSLVCKSIKNSKYFGKLLAYFIASKCYFNFQSISLIGYSLGANVIKYCLKELHKMSCINPELNDIIQNVVFLGGATTFLEKPQTKWSDIFEIVGDRVINVYSTKDYVLHHTYEKFVGFKPIGSRKLYLKNLEGKEIVHNYDFSSIDLGHFDYSTYLDKILEKIKL